MRITQQTSTLLRLQSRWLTSLVGWLMFAVPFLVVGLITLIMLAKVTTLQCNREVEQVQCQLTNQQVLSQRVIPVAEGQLQDVRIETRTRDRNEFHRVVLTLDNQDIALSEAWLSDFAAQQQTVETINAFLKGEQSSLSLSWDDRREALTVGGVMTLIGCLGLLLPLLRVPIYSLRFDKQDDTLTRTRRSLLTTKTTTWALAQVQSATVLEVNDSDGSPYYQANVMLNTGETIPLWQHRAYRRDSLERTTETIRQFLNLPDAD